MGFQIFGKKKDMVDNSDTPENIEVSGNDSTQEINNNENTDKEEGKVDKTEAKKKYMYIALDVEGNVIVDQKGEIFTRVVEEGSSPEWPDIIRNFADKVVIDKELRVEVPDTPSNLSKKDRDKAKREIRDNAKVKLQEIAADRIEKAKALADEKTKQEPTNTVQQEQKIVENNSSEERVKEKIEEKKVTLLEEKPQKEEKAVPIEKNEANIVAAIKVTGDQLNGDINNAVEDILDTMAANSVETVTSIKNGVASQAKHIIDTTVRTVNETAQTTFQKIQKSAENIIGSVNDTKRNISETQDKLVSKVNAVGKRVTDMGESIEGIEGNLHRLDQLDIITELLQNKGLTMSMEIPPVNADEEDIINLVRYSQKITEQLGYAARDLIRKQEAFKSQEEGNANEQKMMDQKIAKAHDGGVLEGEKSFVKQLISKYEDIDTIRESNNSYIHVIWTLLMELGVLIDGNGYYEKGKEIDFTDADIERLIGTYSKLEGAGKYKVVKTGLRFQGEIICKSEFEKINPDNHEDKAEESVQQNVKAQKESGEPILDENVEGNAASDQSINE